MDMIELAERCERGSGPDRELDALIWAALDGRDVRELDHMILARSRRAPHDECLLGWIDPGKERRNFSEATGRMPPFPACTASLDASVALLERVLPGAVWCRLFDGAVWVRVADGAEYRGKCADETTRALLAAILRALAAKDSNHG